ncbi:glycosyltransferase family 4 protein [Myroides marinus]|uniref:glycosyltransferase family 4 protein n=1 Tax=Myroides marinus TaxID=703342 RepID=UPI002574FEC9|nr:glycosyltransferase family 4 protein [Myroides marinus]MDM1362587.1 glycosyltransferase family 4 protein [Myroides marinus]
MGMDSKKVDLIHGSWLYAPNGASSVIRTLYLNSEKFKEEGIEMSYYTMDMVQPRFYSEKKGDIQESNGLKQKIKNVVKGILGRFSSYGFSIYINLFFLYFRHSKAIVLHYLKIKENDPERIIFFHDIFTCYYYLKFKKVTDSNNIVLIMHTDGNIYKMLEYYYPSINNTFVRRILDKIANEVLDRVERIGFVARNPLDVFEKKYNRIGKKDFFIYNGIKPYRYIKREDFSTIKLICVASLSERKNQIELLKALSRLDSDLLKKIHLTLVGGGIIEGSLKELVMKEGLSSNVTFLGFCNNIEELLSENNIFILPSKDEGFPISILEAMSNGMPVLASRIAGIPEMVSDGVNGLLFEPTADSIKLALGKLEVLDMKVLSEASYNKFVSCFSENSMIEKYSILFKAI